jgi:hypothetical protein
LGILSNFFEQHLVDAEEHIALFEAMFYFRLPTNHDLNALSGFLAPIACAKPSGVMNRERALSTSRLQYVANVVNPVGSAKSRHRYVAATFATIALIEGD